MHAAWINADGYSIERDRLNRNRNIGEKNNFPCPNKSCHGPLAYNRAIWKGALGHN